MSQVPPASSLHGADASMGFLCNMCLTDEGM